MKSGRIINYIVAYVLLAVTLASGIWFVLLSRNAFEVFLGKYFIKEESQFLLIRQARFFDLVVPLILWLLWFCFLIVVEEYYRRGAEKHVLWQRFAKVTGVLFLLIFMVDLCQNLLLGMTVVGWLHWLLTALELLVGIALVIASRSKRTLKADKVSLS